MVDVTLEYGVIGGLLKDGKLIPRISAILTEEDFISKSCATIFSCAVNAGKRFDRILAINAISDSEADPNGFVDQCDAYCPSTSNAELYAQKVREAAEERRTRDGVQELLESHSDDLAADIAALCSGIIEKRPARRLTTLEDAAMNAMTEIFMPDTARIDTGFSAVDAILKGFHGSELIIVGARPSVGKSAFALHLAEQAAQRGKVLLYSLEMSSTEIIERFIVRHSNSVTMDDLIDRNLTEWQEKAVADAVNRFYKLPISVIDSPAVTVERIRADAVTTPDLRCIIIDYLGLLTPTKQNPSRNLELGQISRDLKKLALELKIPVVALAQLNRDGGETEKPSLSRLRDSGEIEQNADKVLFLWKYDTDLHFVALTCAKNRRGRCGSEVLKFDGNHMRFTPSGIEYVEKMGRKKGFDIGD